MAARNIKTPGEQVQAPEETTIEVQAEVPQDNALKRASDIDPFTITKSVLTQDGWVCPISLDARRLGVPRLKG